MNAMSRRKAINKHFETGPGYDEDFDLDRELDLIDDAEERAAEAREERRYFD